MSKDWKSVERSIGLLLDRWFGQADGTFRRTPMSGAWDKKKYPGDIYIPPELNIPAVFEIKTESRWDFKSVLTDVSLNNPRTAAFIKYQYQVLKDAVPLKRIPILILTKARQSLYMGIPTPYYKALQAICPVKCPAELRLRNKYMDWTFVLFSERLHQRKPEKWVSAITPEMFREAKSFVSAGTFVRLNEIIQDYEANRPVRRKRGNEKP